jgi:hypothetical protein
VVACARNDDCCSPHPKRRGTKITFDRAVLQPNKTSTLTAFFQGVDVAIEEKIDDVLDIKALTNDQNGDDIIITLVAKDEGECASTPARTAFGWCGGQSSRAWSECGSH